MTSTGNSAGELGHQVEFVPAHQCVEEVSDHLGDERLETSDCVATEHLAHELAHPGVLRRIHHDHHVGLRGPLLQQLLEGHAVGADEANRIAVRRHHVGMAGQRVEAVLLVEIDGGLVAEPCVGGRGIIEERVGKRIEVDVAVRHGTPTRDRPDA